MNENRKLARIFIFKLRFFVFSIIDFSAQKKFDQIYVLAKFLRNKEELPDNNLFRGSELKQMRIRILYTNQNFLSKSIENQKLNLY